MCVCVCVCVIGYTEYALLYSENRDNGASVHYVMVSKFQWKPFWLATQRDPQNDWTATQNRVNYDVFAQALSKSYLPARFTT